MTVKELIQALSELDGSAQVMIHTHCCGCSGGVHKVALSSDNSIVWVEDKL